MKQAASLVSAACRDEIGVLRYTLAAAVSALELSDDWNAWKVHYGKSYSSEVEELLYGWTIRSMSTSIILRILPTHL